MDENAAVSYELRKEPYHQLMCQKITTIDNLYHSNRTDFRNFILLQIVGLIMETNKDFSLLSKYEKMNDFELYANFTKLRMEAGYSAKELGTSGKFSKVYSSWMKK